MAVRQILRMGDPRLQQVSEPVSQFATNSLQELVDDMLETMLANHGAGLAAPQIGVMQRVVIFGVEKNVRYPNIQPVPQTVLINPEIEVLSEETQAFWEGCLSIPDMRGLVERPAHIKYRGYDINGQLIEREATGFHAIVVQHECDHLDGILYPMQMTDMSQFGFAEELASRE